MVNKPTPNSPLSVIFAMLLVLPSSTSYQLEGYVVGGTGGVGTSDTYDMNAVVGELANPQLVSETYDIGPGLSYVLQASTPPAPTFSNPANYYNKLLIEIDPAGNASDTLYAVAISSDSFTTTEYVKADGTVSSELTLADYRTFAGWGSESGELIIGLTPNTSYQVKVAAMHGGFTETAFGPTATAATTGVSLTFDLDVAASDQDTSPPHVLELGMLIAGEVVTASEKIWIDLSTNGEGGGFVYVYSANGGLQSDAAGYMIDSTSTNLATSEEGYGIRSDSLAQASGGPLVALNPYDGSSDTVGAVALETTTLLHTSQTPVVDGRASLLVKAKVSTQTPSANDYTDALTLVASAAF